MLGERVIYSLTAEDVQQLRLHPYARSVSRYFHVGKEFPAVIVGGDVELEHLADLQVFTGPTSLFRRGVTMGRRHGQFHP